MSTTTISRSAVPAGTWTIDPAHSKVGFAVKHMGIATVRGEFTNFEGTLEIGEDLSSAKAYGTVQAQSVDTSEPQRDEHLRSPDFFDAAQYPELRFESTTIEALDEEEFRITGRLSRGDYDMTFNQALGSGNMLVADTVKLALDVSAIRSS
jgi:polyisoprenoid-binding protein YceI